jgi:hypothetical protein
MTGLQRVEEGTVSAQAEAARQAISSAHRMADRIVDPFFILISSCFVYLIAGVSCGVPAAFPFRRSLLYTHPGKWVAVNLEKAENTGEQREKARCSKKCLQKAFQCGIIPMLQRCTGL